MARLPKIFRTWFRVHHEAPTLRPAFLRCSKDISARFPEVATIWCLQVATFSFSSKIPEVGRTLKLCMSFSLPCAGSSQQQVSRCILGGRLSNCLECSSMVLVMSSGASLPSCKGDHSYMVVWWVIVKVPVISSVASLQQWYRLHLWNPFIAKESQAGARSIHRSWILILFSNRGSPRVCDLWQCADIPWIGDLLQSPLILLLPGLQRSQRSGLKGF